MDPELNSNITTAEDTSSLIRICGLNVCGLTTRLKYGVLNKYIKNYDILCFTETKLSKGTEIDNYIVFNLEKPSQYRLPGVHGLSVYVSRQISDHCTQINEPDFECKSVLWIIKKKQF